MKRKSGKTGARRQSLGQLNAFDEPIAIDWPDAERYPHNLPGTSVGSIVQADLNSAADILVVTGYTTLDRVVSLLARADKKRSLGNEPKRIRVLIGHEPSPTRKDAFKSRLNFPGEIADYWLSKGISLVLSADVIRAIHALKAGAVEVRSSDRTPVHAKLYSTENVVTGGSSNYSRAGMEWQIEANWRFTKDTEPRRFLETTRIAEAIWTLGRDYHDDLIELLESLLKATTWQEALARAAADLLEGAWVRKYIDRIGLPDEDHLWPSQESGLAQAMWVLTNVGSVLIADATGSGKTKMGAHLLRALRVRSWRTGKAPQSLPVLICPPMLRNAWIRETHAAGIGVDIHSMGVLSAGRLSFDTTLKAVRRAQVLGIDEAHNFLNRKSNRTRALYASMADSVILFTATPVNRGVKDLLPIIDLLGGDNFDDDTLKLVAQLWKRSRRSNEPPTSGERQRLRGAVKEFTIRRTKTEFNRMIEADPSAYRNTQGSTCRYPHHKPLTYACDETRSDRECARQIAVLSRKLKGVLFFSKPLHLPVRLQGKTSEEDYLRMRLRAARAIASHNVMAALRSSKIALHEHIYGTDVALAKYGVAGVTQKDATGNMVDRLQQIRGALPSNQLAVPLPKWLANVDAHRKRTDREIDLYEQIATIADQISENRENAKAQLLRTITEKHRLVIAFDKRLITLDDLRQRLRRLGVEHVDVATGSRGAAGKRAVVEGFGLSGSADHRVALCSDSMAEGINLQGASAVVLLDIPSVMRLAEQRIGRVDRMDSPHSEIDAYWPEDADEFALNARELFFARHRAVAEILGSNLPLPKGLFRAAPGGEHTVNADAYARLVSERVAAGKGQLVDDVFEPVKQLVAGSRALIPESTYRQLKEATVRIMSAISVVPAQDEWSFYAIGGSDREAPRWVFLERAFGTCTIDLDAIAYKLRQLLHPNLDQTPIPDDIGLTIENDMRILAEHERKWLPLKKQRALGEMTKVLNQYHKHAVRANDSKRSELLERIIYIVENNSASIDRAVVAEWWLDVIRPTWYAYMMDSDRRRPALLRHITPKLYEKPIQNPVLATFFDLDVAGMPLSERIVAAIIGVKGASLDH